MNILIAVNQKYVEHAKTMLCSLFVNNIEESRVYLLHGGLSEQVCEELSSFLRLYGEIDLIPIKIDSNIFTSAPKMKWWSEEMYYRLLAFEYVPENRVLWLDADIIVNGDIREFYYQDIQGFCCSACKGSDQSWTQAIGLDEGQPYFNSGVILYNLEEIRKNYTVEDVFRCLSEHSAALLAPDQDILNLLFQGKVVFADPSIYNHEAFGDYVYSRDERFFIFRQAKIIHFNGSVKPWNPRGTNSVGLLWWKYERLRGNNIAFLRYIILHFPTKCRYELRELYYIVQAQKKKLCRR